MSITDAVQQMLGVPTDPVVESEKPTPSSFGWATVTSTTPLRVVKDGETDPLPMTPEVVGGGVGVGARVWCQFYGLRVLILGAGGTSADTGWVPVTSLAGFGGAMYQRKVGQIVEVAVNITGTFAATANTLVAAPGAVPSGWAPTITDARGVVYGGLGRAMAVWVGTTGIVGIQNHGTAATAAQGRALWMVS